MRVAIPQGPTFSDMSEVKKSRFKFLRVRPSRKDIDDPLEEFSVWWDGITATDATDFAAAVEAAESELAVQAYLEAHPLLLVQHLGGGHGRWVIPQKKLGAEYVPDFVIGQDSSIGFEWSLVELKAPGAKLFTKQGRPAEPLRDALSQIADSRYWLQKNLDYASRDRAENGLGLTDISPDLPGLVIIGRRVDLHPHDKRLRRALMSSHKSVSIHTYDWLIDQAVTRAEAAANLWNRNA